MSPSASGTKRTAHTGLLFGMLAVFFWSFSSTFIYLGAKQLGTWTFVFLATVISGTATLLLRWIRRGELRTAICLPPRLWIITLCGFAAYGIVYPWALSRSSSSQILGVNLINYFWPTLTVVCGVLWVPHTRFNPRILIALLLSLAGIFCANAGDIRNLLSDPPKSPAPSSATTVLPYFLAGAAAVAWAVYSSLLARWKTWASRYLTSGIGLWLTSLIAGVAGLCSGTLFGHTTTTGFVWTILYGLICSAGGYTMWELALSRAKVQTLGLLGAVTPILSILVLCVFLRQSPSPEILLAAGLVGGGVILSVRS